MRTLIAAVTAAVVIVMVVVAVALVATMPTRRSAVIGHAGEWVTREDDGQKVCQLAYDVVPMTPIEPGFCGNWQIEKPSWATPFNDPTMKHWFRCTGGCQLHFADGWRP